MVAFYQGMFIRRSEAELRVIARVKRFMERFCGDALWRNELLANPREAQRLFDAKGIELRAEDVATIWIGQGGTRRGIRATPIEVQGEDTPLALWSSWSADIAKYRDMCRDAACTAAHHPQFDTWRTRQLRRFSRELDPSNTHAINNPLVAYELSNGCSVGCWFCGVSAERFGGYVPYDAETSALWTGMLSSLMERFGQAAATGFCYWATDPSDNPDYCRFIDEHRRITGFLPPTTTAVPMRSLAMTRDILALGDRYRHGNNRFSVLTLKALDDIHQTFNADELLTVDLVLQMNGSLTPKAKVGRGLQNRARIERLQPIDSIVSELEQGSIACVTGFLVNLPRRVVRLVSPCRADEQHLNGYITFAEKSFSDAETFAGAIDQLIAENMRSCPYPNEIAKFSKSVQGCFEDDWFVVQSHVGTERIMPFPFLRRLVDLINEGRHRFRDLAEVVTNDFPGEFLSVGVVLQDLFDAGLFEEMPRSSVSALS
jgi:radical SAM family RiPP maturation amino acid epimerase